MGSVSGLKSEYGKHRTYYTCVAQFWVTCMCFSLQRCFSNTNHLVSLNASLIFLGHSRHLLVVAFLLAIYSAWNSLLATPIKLTRSLLKCLLNEACPGTLLRLNLLPDTPYLVPFTLIFFFGDSLPYRILSIFSFILLFILPPTRIFIPRGQRFLSSCSVFYLQCQKVA